MILTRIEIKVSHRVISQSSLVYGLPNTYMKMAINFNIKLSSTSSSPVWYFSGVNAIFNWFIFGSFRDKNLWADINTRMWM